MLEERKRKIEVAGALITLILALYFMVLLPVSDRAIAAFYDNTTIITKVNVTNFPPYVEDVRLDDNDTIGGVSSIILNQGSTDVLWCNGTVVDRNGWGDINIVNATITAPGYSYEGSSDYNYRYRNSTCVAVETINATSMKFSCTFSVWFFANNGTWTCNMSATDLAHDSSHSAGTKEIAPLYALDLNTSLLDYGQLSPGDYSFSDTSIKITNTGNMDINISVDGFGSDDGDGLAMNCTLSTSIAVGYERYGISPGLTITNMYNLSDTPLAGGIPGLVVLQNQDDGGNSTNLTFWKMEIPLGIPTGYCNGTVTFSAVPES